MSNAWGQKQRFENLAKEMNWAGEMDSLNEFVYKMIGYMPDEIQPDMHHFYLDGAPVPRKYNGKSNTLFYQHLQLGRAVLAVLSKLSVTDLRTLLGFKNEGRW
jgi:hypothetical protein